MNNAVYWRLAWTTLKKNGRVTFPFLLGSIFITACVYSLISLSLNPDLASTYGGNMMGEMLGLGVVVTKIFAVIVFLYINNVLIRSRKQEQGLFTVLGMGRPHLVRIILYQLLILLAGTLVFGILLGIVLDKVMFLLAARLLESEVPLGFRISWPAILDTAGYTLLVYGLLALWSSWKMVRENPLDLLKGEKQAERIPKNRWILALLGVICLGIGYYMALTITDPITAMLMFFVAVLFVIAGTYLLFMYGSIVLINALQKNRNYYYKTNHFISVSLMKFRIQQNAVSLASLAILSTSVLVALSASFSLFYSCSSLIEKQFPKEMMLNVYRENAELSGMIQESICQGIEQSGLASPSIESLRTNSSIGNLSPEGFENLSGPGGDKPFMLVLVCQEDYNRYAKDPLDLKSDEIYGLVADWKADEQIEIEGQSLRYIQSEKAIQSIGSITPWEAASLYEGAVCVVSSPDMMQKLMPDTGIYGTIAFDLRPGVMETALEEAKTSPDLQMVEAGLSEQEIAAQQISMKISASVNAVLESRQLQAFDGEDNPGDYYYYSLQDRETSRIEVLSLYASVLFIGIYVALIFGLAVVLIMYFKQITEGNEDKKRFAILQNAGLEKKQIRKVINDQVLLLFFLPLMTAAMHLAFAFPMISNMLKTAAQGGFDSMGTLFLIVTLVTFAVFALLYVVIYRLTSSVYYTIVRQNI